MLPGEAVRKGTDPEKLREILKRTAPQFLPALEEILASKPDQP